MKKSLIISIIIILIVLIALFILPSKDSNKVMAPDNISETENVPVKEFVMTSFVEFVDGKPKPQFSLKEIEVNKGDTVRLKVTVTSGNHDFKLDEFNVYADTKLNEETVIEFVADQAGTFEYYCNKPGHRANGHFGTLIVLEN